jgi:hypothetical protein
MHGVDAGKLDEGFVELDGDQTSVPKASDTRNVGS